MTGVVPACLPLSDRLLRVILFSSANFDESQNMKQGAQEFDEHISGRRRWCIDAVINCYEALQFESKSGEVDL